MKKEIFNLKLKDYNLHNPEQKKFYNEKLFSEVAPRYDLITGLLSFGRDASWKKRLIDSLPEKNDVHCLDLACGTGDVSFKLAQKYPEGSITGIDLNEDMITIMKKRCSYSNIKFIKADMNSMTFEDNTFDIVTGSYALRNSPDLARTLREIHRLLKPGGKAAFLEFSKYPKPFMAGLEIAILKFWGGIWGAVFHKNPEVYGYIAESLKHFPDKRDFIKMIENTGFTVVKRKNFLFGLMQLLVIEK